jgi:3-oxoacyl-[acyl-carrier protein] reductase
VEFCATARYDRPAPDGDVQKQELWGGIMPGEFAGKVVVVAGGSRGIGRSIAAAFAREGAQTVLAASSPDNLAGAAAAIAKDGGLQPETCAGDLRTLTACEAVHARVK